MDSTTISDEVLVRVLQTSRGTECPAMHRKDLRLHCKNFFVHMTTNYDTVL
jgi:hypothetical protein